MIRFKITGLSLIRSHLDTKDVRYEYCEMIQICSLKRGSRRNGVRMNHVIYSPKTLIFLYENVVNRTCNLFNSFKCRNLFEWDSRKVKISYRYWKVCKYKSYGYRNFCFWPSRANSALKLYGRMTRIGQLIIMYIGSRIWPEKMLNVRNLQVYIDLAFFSE